MSRRTERRADANVVAEAPRPAPEPPGTVAVVPDRRDWLRRTGQNLRRGTVLGSYVAIVIVFICLKPDSFPSVSTVQNILIQSAEPAILVCGLTLVLAVGQIDLSFAAVSSCSSGLVIVLAANQGLNIWLAGALTCLAGLAVGLLIGGIVASGRASAFIITLAASSVLAGVELGLTGNTTIYSGVPASYVSFAKDSFLGLKYPVWIAIAVALVAAVVLHGLRVGRHLQATGDNEGAAYFAGVSVMKAKVIAFAAIGLLAAGGGIINSSISGSYYPGSAGNALLNTFSAVMLGAIGSRFGRYSIWGSILGVLWFTTLAAGLAQLNISAWLTEFVEGAVLICAVLIGAGRSSASKLNVGHG